MKYIDYHDYMHKDAIIYAYLQNNFPYIRKRIKAWESFTLDREDILLVKSGAIFEEVNGKKKGDSTMLFFEKFNFSY